MAYKWKIGQSSPEIDPHSKNKHEVYKNYIARYVKRLNQNPKIPVFRFFIVDGFCGGGVYKDSDGSEHLGSSFIVFSVVKAVLDEINKKRKKPINADLHYYFVDKSSDAIKYLKKEHDARGINHKNLQYLTGDFSRVYPEIIKDIKNKAPKSQKALFILDQYGFSKVCFNVVKDIYQQISFPEFLVTFTPDEIIDQLTSDNQTAKDKIIKTVKKAGLHVDQSHITKIWNNDETTRRILAREYIISLIKEQVGSVYVAPYQIQRPNSHRTLFLVYIARHQAGRDEIINTYWQVCNDYINHQGPIGLPKDILGFDYKREGEILHFRNDFFKDQLDNLINILEEQLPYIIAQEPDGIEVRKVMEIVRQHTTATPDIMKGIIVFLVDCKEIQVIDHKTRKQRNKVKSGIHPNDQIKLSKQLNLFI